MIVIVYFRMILHFRYDASYERASIAKKVDA